MVRMLSVGMLIICILAFAPHASGECVATFGSGCASLTARATAQGDDSNGAGFDWTPYTSFETDGNSQGDILIHGADSAGDATSLCDVTDPTYAAWSADVYYSKNTLTAG